MEAAGRNILREMWVLCGLLVVLGVSELSGQTLRHTKQGYSMRLCFDNRGTMGRVAYPGVIGGTDPGPDSIGLEYPLGQPFEHLFGSGLWVGGILDTAQVGTSTPLKLVSTAFEGWTGPYFEFFPGTSQADTIWEAVGRGIPRPQSWDAYWGDLIRTTSMSDNDRYCLYDDSHVRVSGHIPLRVKVTQSSYVWSDPYAEEIEIVEYRLANTGTKRIDSAYIGVFCEGDVGPSHLTNYYYHNYSAHIPDMRLAYIHNPIDLNSTPVGLLPLFASPSLDSVGYSFRWWPGLNHPYTDDLRYQRLSSGLIDSNQSISNLTETRFLISLGPFTLYPPGGPHCDTVLLACGLVSGQTINAMRQHAERARIIYANGGQVGVSDPGTEAPTRFELFQNYPNPFNPRTTITYTIPVGAYSCTPLLRVFDVLGREVATLVNGVERPGLKSVTFDASSLPSGVYFYQLRLGSFVETKKLVLTK